MHQTKKIWQLETVNLNSIDATYINGLGCDITIERDDPVELSCTGGTYQYTANRPRIIIETSCEKQESMLKLKYGSELVLMQVYKTIGSYCYSNENFNLVSHRRSPT